MERRAVLTELRTAGRRLEGYAAVFNLEARIADFVETIAPGAFAGSLAAGGDIIGLVDHDPAKLLGRTRSGTLQLAEDGKGLSFGIDLPDTGPAHDVLALAARGDLGGMSFSFTVPRGGDHWEGRRRELRAVKLLEVSVVSSWRAYSGTSVNARRAAPRLRSVRLFLATL